MAEEAAGDEAVRKSTLCFSSCPGSCLGLLSWFPSMGYNLQAFLPEFIRLCYLWRQLFLVYKLNHNLSIRAE